MSIETIPFDTRYEALKSRDARFDGRFFTGVVTTGVYCRPVCPAKTPKAENVRFFECAAAAEAAGFRPCRRCRPETAPGTPAWLGTSATVGRALRLIGEGALDTGGVDDLAERLGLGSRHLRRLFDEHLGASPLDVALTRRVHFARKLLDETDLPVRDIAFAAGFASVRRFHFVMARTFGAKPTELRRAARGRAPAAAEGHVALRLPYREPYEFDAILEYLGERATAGVEEVRGGVYRRTFRLDGDAGVLAVRRDARAACLLLEVPIAARKRFLEIAERVRRVFDVGADPASIAEHLARDPALRRSARGRPGLRVPGAWDPFELSVRAILGQQVSVAGATTLAGRLVERWGERVPGADETGPHRLFPEPAVLARANVASIGMPGTRGAAIRELARRVADGTLPLTWGADAEKAVQALAQVRGIGAWTVGYVAMRALGLPDAFLEGDLGVRRALAKRKGELPSPSEVLVRAEAWRPWRAYAVIHLWASAGAAASRRGGSR
ncbi:MAG: AlkA N-terminal domain-containing protein [bacterium]